MNKVGETYGFTSVNFLYVLVSKSPDGQEINLMVVEVKEETIVIDGNHPLAGRDLIFDLEVVEIIASEVKA